MHVFPQVIRWLGCMVFAFGAVNLYQALNSGPETIRLVLSSFLLGDICYTSIFAYWSYRKNIWTIAAIFNLAFSVLLGLARVEALLDLSSIVLENTSELSCSIISDAQVAVENNEPVAVEEFSIGQELKRFDIEQLAVKKAAVIENPPADGQYIGERNETGQRHGKGAYTWPDGGTTYDGQWENDVHHGYGTMVATNGNTYVGDYQCGMKHGHGEYSFFEGGSQYEGQWTNDEMHGVGTYRYPSGTVYYGQFEHNKRHGHGTMKEPNGLKYECEFLNDKFVNDEQLKVKLKEIQKAAKKKGNDKDKDT
jgi:hypothetical protein